jgi:hypothetical protein
MVQDINKESDEISQVQLVELRRDNTQMAIEIEQIRE